MMLTGPQSPAGLLRDAHTSRWQLTSEAFEALLSRLRVNGGPAAAGYEHLRWRLVAFFEKRGCLDATAHADETLDRVARRLQQGKAVDNVVRFAYGVARRVVLESLRARGRAQAALAQPPVAPVTDRVTDDPRLNLLQRQLEQMAPEVRGLLVEYYGNDWPSPRTNRRRLAERLGITYGALKARIHRARTQLETRLLRSC